MNKVVETSLGSSVRCGFAALSVPAAPQASGPPELDTISLSEIVSALSFALDLTEDARPGHAVRSCLLGMRIARELGIAGEQLSSLYYALLLKDVGCSSNSNLMCEMVGGDDRTVKREVKLEDWRRPSLSGLRLLWRNGRPEDGWLDRSRRILRLAIQRNQFNAKLVGMRCERGANIARKIGLSAASAEAIRSLDEHWDGGGYPSRSRKEEIPVLARILNISQYLDIFASERGTEAALDLARGRSGRWFDPALVRIARSLNREKMLWKHYGSGMERRAVLDLEPGAIVRAGERQVDSIAEAFADVVDAKSSFTYKHSLGVTSAAMRIARELGFAGDRLKLVYRAALLHDLGKLRVPNTILDKPGKLDMIEWQVVQEHPGLSSEILGRIKRFKDMARIAGEHHEKLDGSGYPGNLKSADLSVESRIIAVADIYGALSEDRPYRAGLSRDEIFAIMSRDVPLKLDAACFEALFTSLDAEERTFIQIAVP